MTSDEQTGHGRRSRRLLAGFFIGAGVNHFVSPRAYERIVPPRLQGDAKRVVQISGAAEIAGGVGVLLPGVRRLSGLWLVGAARRRVPLQPVHGAVAGALPADPTLGAVREAAAAAADDVVGVEVDPAMSGCSQASGPRRCYVRLRGSQTGPSCRPRPPSRSHPPSRRG